MNSIAVGIDVSKARLEVCLASEGGVRRLAFFNDGPGIRELVATCPPGCAVHLEATGGYERPVRRALQASGFDVRVHNPRRTRRFADLQGVSAKTDRLDAEVLSQAGALKAPARPKSAEQEELCDLSRHVQTLKGELAGHRKRAQCFGLTNAMLANLRRLDRALAKEIARLEAQYESVVRKSSRARDYELAQTVPCVGPGLARVLSAELPEDLANWNGRQIGSLAGVAPIDDESGEKARPSRVGGNANARLKAALYMPAMVAVQRQEWAKGLYARLRAKGKVHRQAIVAVMRRLLMKVLAVLRRGSAWSAEPPVRA